MPLAGHSWALKVRRWAFCKSLLFSNSSCYTTQEGLGAHMP
jgi:hypothetical protein